MHWLHLQSKIVAALPGHFDQRRSINIPRKEQDPEEGPLAWIAWASSIPFNPGIVVSDTR